MPGPPDDRRLILVVSLLALLFGTQLAALAAQLRGGYRPFGAPPVRVGLSWDMFSTRIERCDLSWEPSLPWPGRGGLGRLTELSPSIEWFVVRDSVEGYRRAGFVGCARARQPTRLRLRCWLPDGTERREELSCR